MNRRDLRTTEHKWRDDQRSRPTYTRKRTKPPRTISLKQVATVIFIIAVSLKVLIQ